MASDIDLGIDHLTDVTKIGQGGFSVVYAASHTLFKRRMAVKLLNALNKESERLRFERECEVMGRLSDHPNVVSVYNAGYTTSDRPYLLMELVEGGTLQDRLEKGGPLPWREAVSHLLPICEALEAAHAESILHRDVKPENILLAPDGQPRLADFGIASLRDATGATSTHITASMLHTAPETFENLRDERSDLYSLASTLFALIVGRAPFWHDADQSIHPLMNRLLHDPAPALPPSLGPPELSAFLQRALAKDPNHRPQNAAEFAGELRRVAGDELSKLDANPGDDRSPSTVLVSPSEPARLPAPPVTPAGPHRQSGPTPPQPRVPSAPVVPSPWAPNPMVGARPGPVDGVAPRPIPVARPSTGPTAPGWYPAPGDPPGTQRYWDGGRWQGGPQRAGSTGGVATSGPVPGSAHGLAPPERRMLARSVDLGIWVMIWIVVLLLAIPSSDNENASYLQILALGLWSTAGMAAYEIGMVSLFGATFGKMIFGLRVVREDGSPAGFSAAAMRMVLFIVLSVASSALWLPSLIMVVLAGVAVSAIYSNERRQTLWDRQAKTLVVRQ